MLPLETTAGEVMGLGADERCTVWVVVVVAGDV
jgi:hypothetical protein